MNANPYMRPLSAIKAQLQGLIFPDVVNGVLTDPPLIRLMLEDSDIVGTNGRPNGGIICRVMDMKNLEPENLTLTDIKNKLPF